MQHLPIVQHKDGSGPPLMANWIDGCKLPFNRSLRHASVFVFGQHAPRIPTKEPSSATQHRCEERTPPVSNKKHATVQAIDFIRRKPQSSNTLDQRRSGPFFRESTSQNDVATRHRQVCHVDVTWKLATPKLCTQRGCRGPVPHQTLEPLHVCAVAAFHHRAQLPGGLKYSGGQFRFARQSSLAARPSRFGEFIVARWKSGQGDTTSMSGRSLRL